MWYNMPVVDCSSSGFHGHTTITGASASVFGVGVLTLFSLSPKLLRVTLQTVLTRCVIFSVTLRCAMMHLSTHNKSHHDTRALTNKVDYHS